VGLNDETPASVDALWSRAYRRLSLSPPPPLKLLFVAAGDRKEHHRMFDIIDMDATVVLPDGIVGASRVAGRSHETGPADRRRRCQRIAAARIAISFVWSVGAWYQWQRALAGGFNGRVAGADTRWPHVVMPSAGLWMKIVATHTHLLAVGFALGETAVAVGLVVGVFAKSRCVAGGFLAAAILSTVVSFGFQVAGSGVIDASDRLSLFVVLWAVVESVAWLGRLVARVGAGLRRR
jgi:hypothetical protein